MSKRHRHLISQPPLWLAHVASLRGANHTAILATAMDLYANEASELLEKGIGIADILLTLGLDNETLTAALIYPLLQAKHLPVEIIAERFGESISKLLHDILQMQSFTSLQNIEQRSHQQVENLRKMILAMITDVRTVLLVLAERLWQLYQAKSIDASLQKALAQESINLYAPLANRLGIWQIKWEMEDLCLRYLKPDVYNDIAKGLSIRRDEREAYIQTIKKTLTEVLQQEAIHEFQISGRVKHIYSIYNKMQRKNADLKQIYDITALRVLVSSIDDCYTVLSILQNHWPQLTEEFDDYITHPKANGYRSIHTVIIGSNQDYVEVQIRTHAMHQESELGVAAHWRYKEGVLQTANYEAKIALMRQVMAWQKDIVSTNETKTDKALSDLFADRVYVFTPTGDIVDLQQGATPLDFAYQIHSEVGHRCRGAKINGNIVPLTHSLQTGDRIEILTAKQANPSRDWMNPHLHYLKTARARAKVQHWFRIKDSIERTLTGREMLERELKKMGLNIRMDLQPIAEKLQYKTDEAMLAALAAGELRLAQIIHQIKPEEQAPLPLVNETSASIKPFSGVQILGINNLLTHIALCCKPLPGDAIIGYVTRNRGVSIHRRDCSNMPHIDGNNEERIISVNWGEQAKNAYPADLLIHVYDRAGLLRDITSLLSAEKMNVLGLQTQKHQDSAEVDIYLTIEIVDRQQLNRALDMLRHVPNVLDVRRR